MYAELAVGMRRPERWVRGGGEGSYERCSYSLFGNEGAGVQGAGKVPVEDGAASADWHVAGPAACDGTSCRVCFNIHRTRDTLASGLRPLGFPGACNLPLGLFGTSPRISRQRPPTTGNLLRTGFS